MSGHFASSRVSLSLVVLAFLAVSGEPTVRSQDPSKTVFKTEHFDRDPGWDGHNNRIVPKNVLMVKQDFGFSATQFAGKAKGEIGGRVRAMP